MRSAILITTLMITLVACGQPSAPTISQGEFMSRIMIPATPVKNQAMTGTCWCFSTTSLVESETLRNTKKEFDISEMFTVRNIYLEKANNYILRQGKTQFGEGGLGHDLIRAISTYGAEPESVYSGLVNGQKSFDHQVMSQKLQEYLDGILKKRPVPENWKEGYVAILDQYMGKAPATFDYSGKNYTPQTFAKDVMKFNADDYVSITSFSHHPYYSSFVLETPDNFANAAFYNLPLTEMIDLVKTAVKGGYSIMWDADVSNVGFQQQKGLALNLEVKGSGELTADSPEAAWSQEKRQELYENLTTQDDHLMHIVGTEKSKAGKDYFLVKNSWGKVGPYEGYINVSEGYFAINTVSLVVPKAAIPAAMLSKLGVR